MGLCCDKEIKLVHDSLEPLEGVTRVSVNVVGRVVLVHYDAALVEVGELVAALNRWQLGASVQGHEGVARRELWGGWALGRGAPRAVRRTMRSEPGPHKQSGTLLHNSRSSAAPN